MFFGYVLEELDIIICFIFTIFGHFFSWIRDLKHWFLDTSLPVRSKQKTGKPVWLPGWRQDQLPAMDYTHS